MKLLTSRLILKKYESADLEDFCKVICNDEVMLHISGKGNSREIAIKKFNALLKTNQENEYYGVYKVTLKETNTVIGFAKIVPYENNQFEIGYALLASFWRKGFTLEMIDKMTNHCLNYFPDKKIMAIVNRENTGSIKILEKCNFKNYKEDLHKSDPCLFFEFVK